MVGDIVEYIGEYDPDDLNRFVPPYGTKGTVLKENERYSLVQWEEGTTEGNGIWLVANYDIRGVPKKCEE